MGPIAYRDECAGDESIGELGRQKRLGQRGKGAVLYHCRT
jgi:hypothetical protein